MKFTIDHKQLYFAVQYQFKEEQGMLADILQCFCVPTSIIWSLLVILAADSKKIKRNVDVLALIPNFWWIHDDALYYWDTVKEYVEHVY